MIVAAAKNRAIGQHGRIPWRLRDDLIRLKQLTLGQVVILGRKSYDSMVGYYKASGRPMPGKLYIVVTRNPDYTPDRDADKAVGSVDMALKLARQFGEEVFVIGGGEIFKSCLPFTQKIYYTEVDFRVDQPDAFFPELDINQWREISREHHQKDDRNEFDFDFVVYQRVDT